MGHGALTRYTHAGPADCKHNEGKRGVWAEKLHNGNMNLSNSGCTRVHLSLGVNATLVFPRGE